MSDELEERRDRLRAERGRDAANTQPKRGWFDGTSEWAPIPLEGVRLAARAGGRARLVSSRVSDRAHEPEQTDEQVERPVLAGAQDSVALGGGDDVNSQPPALADAHDPELVHEQPAAEPMRSHDLPALASPSRDTLAPDTPLIPAPPALAAGPAEPAAAVESRAPTRVAPASAAHVEAGELDRVVIVELEPRKIRRASSGAPEAEWPL